MILIDRVPLDLESLNDPKAKHHDFAKEYNETLTFLRDRFPKGVIYFKRKNAQKYTKGMDNMGREVPKLAEPIVPWRIPLKDKKAMGNKGVHEWACCLDSPEPQANGLWDMGRTRGLTIKGSYTVNLNTEPDLAFFLYNISRFTMKGLIAVADPKKDDEELGEMEKSLTERKYAVWNMLGDISKLHTMARGYGVNNVDEKQPNAIRKELESLLEKNDKLKRQNPAVKGTKEFIEEMQVTDGLLLRSFIQKSIDEKKLEYRQDGRWRIGNKIIVQVPAKELSRKMDYLCGYLMAGNNIDKLQEFLRDLLDKDYLASIPDGKDGNKEWKWLAKIANVPHDFKKMQDVKDGVTKFFTPI